MLQKVYAHSKKKVVKEMKQYILYHPQGLRNACIAQELMEALYRGEHIAIPANSEWKLIEIDCEGNEIDIRELNNEKETCEAETQQIQQGNQEVQQEETWKA
jgi:hypothetical protein